MRLSKVQISHFKEIKDWEIDLKPGFNLIKRTNGEGLNQRISLKNTFLDNRVKYKTDRDKTYGH